MLDKLERHLALQRRLQLLKSLNSERAQRYVVQSWPARQPVTLSASGLPAGRTGATADSVASRNVTSIGEEGWFDVSGTFDCLLRHDAILLRRSRGDDRVWDVDGVAPDHSN